MWNVIYDGYNIYCNWSDKLLFYYEIRVSSFDYVSDYIFVCFFYNYCVLFYYMLFYNGGWKFNESNERGFIRGIYWYLFSIINCKYWFLW